MVALIWFGLYSVIVQTVNQTVSFRQRFQGDHAVSENKIIRYLIFLNGIYPDSM